MNQTTDLYAVLASLGWGIERAHPRHDRNGSDLTSYIVPDPFGTPHYIIDVNTISTLMDEPIENVPLTLAKGPDTFPAFHRAVIVPFLAKRLELGL